MKMLRLIAHGLACTAIVSCSSDSDPAGNGSGADAGPGVAVVLVEASAETPSSRGDPDDPAVWVHPSDPGLSRILTTDKDKGRFVYDLAGTQVQALEDFELNNIDIRYGVPLGARMVDLAVATNRRDDTLALFVIDSDTGEVSLAEG